MTAMCKYYVYEGYHQKYILLDLKIEEEIVIKINITPTKEQNF
jgi:hypothetical protein